MEHRIRFKRRDQQNTLQSHLLVPVSINGRSPFPSLWSRRAPEHLSRPEQLKTLGLSLDDSSPTLAISEKLAFSILRVDSIAVGGAVLNNFEVVVWGSAVVPQEIMANLKHNVLYPLGNLPASAIEAVIECRGILGADFLRNFALSFDFNTEDLILEA